MNCGVNFNAAPSAVKSGGGKFCGHPCRADYRQKSNGRSRSLNWRSDDGTEFSDPVDAVHYLIGDAE
jgi:hypothetical protein